MLLPSSQQVLAASAAVSTCVDAAIGPLDAISTAASAIASAADILITDALDVPFYVQNRQRPGKMHRVEKLVDIWEYYEQVPTLRVGLLGGRVP